MNQVQARRFTQALVAKGFPVIADQVGTGHSNRRDPEMWGVRRMSDREVYVDREGFPQEWYGALVDFDDDGNLVPKPEMVAHQDPELARQIRDSEE
jgi:hypothetical protein